MTFACFVVCSLKVWWQADEPPPKAKGEAKEEKAKEEKAKKGEAKAEQSTPKAPKTEQAPKPKVEKVVAAVEAPVMDAPVGKTIKEVKADRVPEGPRPNLITVPEADFTVKETNPDLGRAVDYKQHYDLVEEMSYLFVRVARARNLMGKDNNGLSDPVSLSSMLLNCHYLEGNCFFFTLTVSRANFCWG